MNDDYSWQGVCVVALAMFGKICHWAGKLIDKRFDAWLKTEGARRQRIEKGTACIVALVSEVRVIKGMIKDMKNK